jgi:ZIP family zinc transporter
VVALSLVVGAFAAANLRLSAAITAFGGGLLLAAVAIELVPDADAEAGPALTAAGLAAGTLLYVGADAWLSRNESRQMRRAMQAAASGRPMSDAMAAAESASGPDHRRRALARLRVG